MAHAVRAFGAPRPVTYARADDRCASFRGFLEWAIAASGARRICDLGGGANPLLDRDFLERMGLRCVLLDISPAELSKAPAGYERVVADIGSRDFLYQGPRFDLVFSRMVAEHIRDAATFHRNVRELLAPRGWAVHCFPTLYAPPFLVNRMLPERMADRLLHRVQPRNRHQHAKFPAYYRWCRGPGRRAIGRLQRAGYDVVEYRGLFGHPYYGHRSPLALASGAAARFLLRHPRPWLTSYAYLALRAL